MEVKQVYSIEHYEHFLRVKHSVRYYSPFQRNVAGARYAEIEKDLRANIDPDLIKAADEAFYVKFQ